MIITVIALILGFALGKAWLEKKKNNKNRDFSYALRHAVTHPLVRKSISLRNSHVHTCCTIPGFGLPSGLS